MTLVRWSLRYKNPIFGIFFLIFMSSLVIGTKSVLEYSDLTKKVFLKKTYVKDKQEVKK